MKLHIVDESKTLTLSFGQWLCGKIHDLLVSQVDFRKLTGWSEYLKDNSLIVPFSGTTLDAKLLFLAGANNLVATGDAGDITIQINPNVYAVGYDRLKIATACRLINFGDMSHIGYSIFTDVFEDVSVNISTYVDQYMLFLT